MKEYTEKLILLLARTKMTKTRVSEILGISRPTLDILIKNNDINENDYKKIKSRIEIVIE